MSLFEIKQGDLLPAITATLKQAVGTPNEAPIDLTAATAVTIKLREQNTKRLRLNAAATFVSRAAGTVAYQWVGTDTAAVGLYDLEWTITFPGGPMTVPSKDYDTVVVTAKLDFTPAGLPIIAPAPPVADGNGIIIQQRRNTTAGWTATNPILAAGQLGVEVDTYGTTKTKVGDGTRPWSTLPYAPTAQGLTGDGNIPTQAAGVPAEITRATLAGDPVFASRYAPLPVSDLTIILGDSIAAGSDVAGTFQGGSWFSYLCKASGARIQYLRNAGIPGNNTTQMLARIQTDVIAYAPGWCIVTATTPNDQTQINNLATSKANVVAMLAALRVAGIRPIVTLGAPHSTPAVNTYVASMNAWMSLYAVAHGIPVLDLHTPLTDPTTGLYYATMNDGDGTHPNNAGMNAIADYNLARIPAAFGRGPYLTDGIGDTANLIPNGCFIGDSNADGIADTWVIYGGAFTSKALVPMTAAEGVGNWQELQCNGAQGYILCSIRAFWAEGDLLEFTGKFQCDVGLGVSVGFSATLGGSSIVNPVSGWNTQVTTPYVFQARVVLSAGTSNPTPTIAVSTGAGKLRVGQLTLRNLTALGVV